MMDDSTVMLVGIYAPSRCWLGGSCLWSIPSDLTLPSSIIRLHAVLLVGAIGIPNNLQYGRALLLWVILTLTSVTQILVLEVKWYPSARAVSATKNDFRSDFSVIVGPKQRILQNVCIADV